MIIFPVIILVLGLGVHRAHSVVLEVDLVQVWRNGQRRPIKLSFFVRESQVFKTLVEQLLETSLILHNILTHLFRVPSNSHILEALWNPEFYCSVKTPWIAVVNPKQKYSSYRIIDATVPDRDVLASILVLRFWFSCIYLYSCSMLVPGPARAGTPAPGRPACRPGSPGRPSCSGSAPCGSWPTYIYNVKIYQTVNRLWSFLTLGHSVTRSLGHLVTIFNIAN